MAYIRSGNGGGGGDVVGFFEDTSNVFIDGGSATGNTISGIEVGKHYLVVAFDTNTSGNAFPSATYPKINSGATEDRILINHVESGVRSRIYAALVTATATSIVFGAYGSGRKLVMKLD